MKAYRPERMNRLAGFLNRFNLLLVTARRNQCPDPVVGSDVNRSLSRNRLIHIADACDVVLSSNAIDASADANVAAACEIKASRISDSGVAVTGPVVPERLRTHCRVELATRIVKERQVTNGGVIAAFRVLAQCTTAVGGVAGAGGVATQGGTAGGRVLRAGRVAVERFKTSCRVVGAVSVGIERRKTGGRVVIAFGVAKERLITAGRVLEAGGVA